MKSLPLYVYITCSVLPPTSPSPHYTVMIFVGAETQPDEHPTTRSLEFLVVDEAESFESTFHVFNVSACF